MPIRCKLAVNNKLIQQSMPNTYLGVEITSCKNLQQEVRTQVNKASRISGCLRSCVEEQIYSLKTKSAFTKQL